MGCIRCEAVYVIIQVTAVEIIKALFKLRCKGLYVSITSRFNTSRDRFVIECTGVVVAHTRCIFISDIFGISRFTLVPTSNTFRPPVVTKEQLDKVKLTHLHVTLKQLHNQPVHRVLFHTWHSSDRRRSNLRAVKQVVLCHIPFENTSKLCLPICTLLCKNIQY